MLRNFISSSQHDEQRTMPSSLSIIIETTQRTGHSIIPLWQKSPVLTFRTRTQGQLFFFWIFKSALNFSIIFNYWRLLLMLKIAIHTQQALMKYIFATVIEIFESPSIRIGVGNWEFDCTWLQKIPWSRDFIWIRWLLLRIIAHWRQTLQMLLMRLHHHLLLQCCL